MTAACELRDAALADAFRLFKNVTHPATPAGALFRAIEEKAKELGAPTNQVLPEIEAVARAIACENNSLPVESSDQLWLFVGEDIQARYIRMARAAIAAFSKATGVQP